MKPVPKLDFKRLKMVQEFKDWYTYSCKLEDSVKYLRQRVKQVEDDNQSLNEKYRKEEKAKVDLFTMNEKLTKGLKRANQKIEEVKEKYREKWSKKCYYCNNAIAGADMLGMNGTFDQIHVTSTTTHQQPNKHADIFYRKQNSKNVIVDDLEDIDLNEEDASLVSSDRIRVMKKA